MFDVISNNQFEIRFSNGWTVNIAWQWIREGGGTQKIAEVSAWNEYGMPYDFEDKSQWKSSDEVAAFLSHVSKL